MSKRSLDEAIVAAARDEPLPLEERERLHAALDRDAAARQSLAEQQALGADLVALRGALDALPVPDDGRALTAAFRHAHVQSRERSRRRRRYAAAAAAVALAFAAALCLPRFARAPAPAAEQARVAATPLEPPAAAFRALPYGPGVTLGGSYSVVRVRLPLSALTAGFAAGGQTVEADVLVGEDGLVSAIRFDRNDIVYVSTNQ